MKRRGTFRKNVIEKKWAVLCRNSYGEEECRIVKGETETVAASQIPKELTVIDVQEAEE